MSGDGHPVNQGSGKDNSPPGSTNRAGGLAAFVQTGRRHGGYRGTTMSEFGRAVAENGNRGTDHGHGNAMMALGGGIRGGRVYGKWPGLGVERRYEGRDLAITTDFRTCS